MSQRIYLAVTVACLCAAALTAIAIAAPSGGSRAAGSPLIKHGLFYGTTLPADGPALEFALEDQSGQLIRLDSFGGRVVAVTFVYSTCQDTCATVLEELTQAIDELPHPVPALAISVDPKQDTATNVKAFLVKQQLLTQWHYLVGRRGALLPIWRHFAVTPQRRVNSPKADFSVSVVLLDKRGRARVSYRGLPSLDPDLIAADLRTLQAEPVSRSARRRVNI